MRAVLGSVILAGACTPAGFDNQSCRGVEGACVMFTADEVDALVDQTNLLTDDLTIVLGEGTFALDTALTLRGADGITLIGQGMNRTTLDFSATTAQSNGVDAVGDRLTLEGFEVVDAKKDGVRIEDSADIVVRRVRATWSGGPDPDNGAYGLYPVRVTRVLMEDSEATFASDAGIYVGQCQHAIIRNNRASGNVAGIEIENTQYADVYGNTAEDNTGGLVVFDLPGNPIVGRDVSIHDNTIVDNNQDNFAPGGTVAMIPRGTGTFILASRRVEIFDNVYEENDTGAVAILSGLVIEDQPQWALTDDEIIGDISDLDLPMADGAVFNHRTTEVYLHGNTFTDNGLDPDMDDPTARELGAALGFLYGTAKVDDVLYDGIEESAFDPDDPANTSNDNHICVGDNGGATMATLDLGNLIDQFDAPPFPTTDDILQLSAPYAPYDCSSLTAGPLQAPDWPVQAAPEAM